MSRKTKNMIWNCGVKVFELAVVGLGVLTIGWGSCWLVEAFVKLIF